MGFFSKWKAANHYYDSLKSCGVNPVTLPADLNSRVCSYTNQDWERSIIGQILPLELQMEQAGELVALCVLGPTEYSRRANRYATVSMADTAAVAAQDWRKNGPDSSLNAKIIQTVSDAGVLHVEFANAFNAML